MKTRTLALLATLPIAAVGAYLYLRPGCTIPTADDCAKWEPEMHYDQITNALEKREVCVEYKKDVCEWVRVVR